MAERGKQQKTGRGEASSEEVLKILLAQEREAHFRLREIVLALGQLNLRRPKTDKSRSGPPTVAAAAGAEEDEATELRQIYYALLDLFEDDHKNVTHVTPATVLGEYPLGYDRRALQDFYDESVYQRFGVRISTNEVGTDGSVWDLAKQVYKEGGRA